MMLVPFRMKSPEAPLVAKTKTVHSVQMGQGVDVYSNINMILADFK